MKSTNRLRASLLGSSLLACAPSLLAQTYTRFWDGGTVNGGNPAANANGGDGTWNETLTNWDSAATGGTDVTSGNNLALFFGGTAGNVATAGGAATRLTTLGFGTTGYQITGVFRFSNLGTMYIESGVTTTLGSSGGFQFNHARTIDILSNGELIVDGVISNTTGGNTEDITKSGAGTLTLKNANTYDGSTLITVGVVNIRHANALGDTTEGTTVSSNAALQIQGGITTAAEALGLSGTGVSTTGALRNISGNNTYTGAITLNGATRINSDSGTLTLDRASGDAIIGINRNLTFGGTGNITVADAIATGTGTLTKDGAGKLTLSGTNTYTGTTNVNAGTLEIGTTGSTDAGSAVTVSNSGSELVVNGIINGTLNANVSTTISGSGGTVAGAATINGNLAPGTIATPGATLTFGSTLTLGTDSILAFGLGTTSDLIDFTTAANNLLGSGNAMLNLTLLSGFSYANTYTIFQDTTTTGYTLEGITGYDTVNYTANFFESGDN